MPKMSEQQLRAVEFMDGVLLLLAGPGSGKTFVLTHRIKHLTMSGIDSSHILVITFTKAAALQMKDRFLKLVSPDTPEVVFGTFHAVFYNILKSQPAYRRMTPVKDKEKLNILKRVAEIIPDKDALRDKDDYLNTLSLISACKNNGNNPGDFEQNMYEQVVFERIFNEYNRLMIENDYIDFDDMINLCLKSLGSNPEILKKWQSRFSYILIDEFQDISGNQYELIKLLAFPENNIFAVGDDDQSIYSFRGARVELMEKLLSDYPDSNKEYLSTNYRCCGAIVSKAGEVIRDNRKRFEKNIVSSREYGCDVNILCAVNEAEQDKHILDIIGRYKDKPAEIALLTRTNRMAKKYADFLRVNGYSCISAEKSLPFSSGYIKDICAFLALAEGENNRSQYLRIINKPSRYVSRSAMPSENVDRDDLLKLYRGDTNMIRRLREFFDGIDRIKRMPPALAIRYIRNVMGYDKYVRDSVSYESYMQYCDEMKLFGEFTKGCGNYYDLIDKLKLYQDSFVAAPKTENEEGIHIMTYHGSKGLEFDVVILPDVNENVCPSKSSHTEREIEEERRMFYVAMTRAKDELHILYRTDENRKPSRFLKI